MIHDDAVKKIEAQMIFNKLGYLSFKFNNSHMIHNGHKLVVIYPVISGISTGHCPFNNAILPKSRI